jgi:hypothetical protein
MTALESLARQARQNPSDLLSFVQALAKGEPIPHEAVITLLNQSRALVGLVSDYSCEETALEDAHCPSGGISHENIQGTLTTAEALISLALVALDK